MNYANKAHLQDVVSEKPRSLAFNDSLASLSAARDRLAEVVRDTEDRLEPFLRPEPPPTVGNQVPTPVGHGSSACVAVDAITDEVGNLTRRMRMIMDRLY